MLKPKDINFSNVKTSFLGYDKDDINSKTIFIRSEYTKLYNTFKDNNQKIIHLEKDLEFLTIRNYELEKKCIELERKNQELEQQFKTVAKDISIVDLAKQHISEDEIIKSNEKEETLEEILKRNHLIGDNNYSSEGFAFI